MLSSLVSHAPPSGLVGLELMDPFHAPTGTSYGHGVGVGMHRVGSIDNMHRVSSIGGGMNRVGSIGGGMHRVDSITGLHRVDSFNSMHRVDSLNGMHRVSSLSGGMNRVGSIGGDMHRVGSVGFLASPSPDEQESHLFSPGGANHVAGVVGAYGHGPAGVVGGSMSPYVVPTGPGSPDASWTTAGQCMPRNGSSASLDAPPTLLETQSWPAAWPQVPPQQQAYQQHQPMQMQMHHSHHQHQHLHQHHQQMHQQHQQHIGQSYAVEQPLAVNEVHGSSMHPSSVSVSTVAPTTVSTIVPTASTTDVTSPHGASTLSSMPGLEYPLEAVVMTRVPVATPALAVSAPRVHTHSASSSARSSSSASHASSESGPAATRDRGVKRERAHSTTVMPGVVSLLESAPYTTRLSHKKKARHAPGAAAASTIASFSEPLTTRSLLPRLRQESAPIMTGVTSLTRNGSANSAAVSPLLSPFARLSHRRVNVANAANAANAAAHVGEGGESGASSPSSAAGVVGGGGFSRKDKTSPRSVSSAPTGRKRAATTAAVATAAKREEALPSLVLSSSDPLPLPTPADGVITGSGNGLAAGVTIPKPVPGKRGGGFSCHCCKTSKRNLVELFLCTNILPKHAHVRASVEAARLANEAVLDGQNVDDALDDANAGSAGGAGGAAAATTKKCKKKYCLACMRRLYTRELQTLRGPNEDQWTCPSCLNRCSCAGCERKVSGHAEAPWRRKKPSATLTKKEKAALRLQAHVVTVATATAVTSSKKKGRRGAVAKPRGKRATAAKVKVERGAEVGNEIPPMGRAMSLPNPPRRLGHVVDMDHHSVPSTHSNDEDEEEPESQDDDNDDDDDDDDEEEEVEADAAEDEEEEEDENDDDDEDDGDEDAEEGDLFQDQSAGASDARPESFESYDTFVEPSPATFHLPTTPNTAAIEANFAYPSAHPQQRMPPSYQARPVPSPVTSPHELQVPAPTDSSRVSSSTETEGGDSDKQRRLAEQQRVTDMLMHQIQAQKAQQQRLHQQQQMLMQQQMQIQQQQYYQPTTQNQTTQPPQQQQQQPSSQYHAPAPVHHLQQESLHRHSSQPMSSSHHSVQHSPSASSSPSSAPQFFNQSRPAETGYHMITPQA